MQNNLPKIEVNEMASKTTDKSPNLAISFAKEANKGKYYIIIYYM